MTIMGITCIVQRRCSDRQQTAQDRDEKRQEIHWNAKPGNDSLQELISVLFEQMTDAAF